MRGLHNQVHTELCFHHQANNPVPKVPMDATTKITIIQNRKGSEKEGISGEELGVDKGTLDVADVVAVDEGEGDGEELAVGVWVGELIVGDGASDVGGVGVGVAGGTVNVGETVISAVGVGVGDRVGVGVGGGNVGVRVGNGEGDTVGDDMGV